MLHVQPRLLDLPQFGPAVNAASIKDNPINMTEEERKIYFLSLPNISLLHILPLTAHVFTFLIRTKYTAQVEMSF